MIWGGVFGVAIFLFWHVPLNKNSKYGAAFEQTSAKVVIALPLFWTLVTVGTYLYFRKPWGKASVEPTALSNAEPTAVAAGEPVTVPAAEASPAPMSLPKSL